MKVGLSKKPAFDYQGLIRSREIEACRHSRKQNISHKSALVSGNATAISGFGLVDKPIQAFVLLQQLSKPRVFTIHRAKIIKRCLKNPDNVPCCIPQSTGARNKASCNGIEKYFNWYWQKKKIIKVDWNVKMWLAVVELRSHPDLLSSQIWTSSSPSSISSTSLSWKKRKRTKSSLCLSTLCNPNLTKLSINTKKHLRIDFPVVLQP